MIKSMKIRPGKIVVYSLLFIFAAIFFSPFVWMVSTSLKTSTNVFTNPPQWIPKPIQPENYVEVFQRMPFFKYLKNTLIVAVISVLGELISAPMIAYSITKIPWKGGKYIFPVILATMMIPWQVTQIPLFVTWSKFDLVNTLVPLTLPSFFGAPYYIYLMRQFIKGIPDSIIEASRIDGAGEVRILYQIVYPMCRAVLTTVALLVFISSWNDLNGPLIYLQDGSKYTLSIGLQNFLTSTRREWELLMAAATLFTIPLIVLFFVGQKQFISGISTTGLK